MEVVYLYLVVARERESRKRLKRTRSQKHAASARRGRGKLRERLFERERDRFASRSTAQRRQLVNRCHGRSYISSVSRRASVNGVSSFRSVPRLVPTTAAVIPYLSPCPSCEFFAHRRCPISDHSRTFRLASRWRDCPPSLPPSLPRLRQPVARALRLRYCYNSSTIDENVERGRETGHWSPGDSGNSSIPNLSVNLRGSKADD